MPHNIILKSKSIENSTILYNLLQLIVFAFRIFNNKNHPIGDSENLNLGGQQTKSVNSSKHELLRQVSTCNRSDIFTSYRKQFIMDPGDPLPFENVGSNAPRQRNKRRSSILKPTGSRPVLQVRFDKSCISILNFTMFVRRI